MTTINAALKGQKTAMWQRDRLHNDVADCLYHGIALDPHNLPTMPYEQVEVDMARFVLQPGMRVVLAGFGKGFLALAVATIVGPENVFGYEAEEQLVNMTQDDVRLWGHVLKPTHAGLAVRSRHDGKPGEQMWRFLDADPSWHSTRVSRFATLEQVRIPALDINEEIAAQHADALVLDVEGSEVEIFDALDLTPIRAVVTEVHEGLLGRGYAPTDRIRKLLTDAGLTKYQLRRDARYGVAVIGACRP